MREPRRSARALRLARLARLALGGVLASAFPLALAACGGPPSGFPDSNDVTTAQAAWCKALGKVNGAGDKWESMSACKSAYPTASAAFLRGLTKCYVARREAAGETAPDNTQILADCTDEVTVSMSNDTSAGREALAARCVRMERCEKVAIPECEAALAKLEAATRVLISTRFNGAALHTVADCLSSASCAANEDEPREACYKPVTEKLLWFP
jgi:hypothetical protein